MTCARCSVLVIAVAACGSPMPFHDAGSGVAEICTRSTCDDAVGTWEPSRGPGDAGSCLLNGGWARLPIHRDGGDLCMPATVTHVYPAKTSLSSDGGCGLTIRVDEGRDAMSMVLMDQTFDVVVSGSTFSGTAHVVWFGDISGQCTVPVSGTRR